MKRKGYGIGKGQGYKNMMPMDSYIHSLSAKGVKTRCILKMPKKLKAMGTMKSFVIDSEYSVVVWYEDTRSGFRHLAKLMQNGREVETAKAVYYNRTWERYKFQSVINSVIRKHFDEKKAEEKIKLLEKKAGLYRTDAKGKKNPVNKDNLVNYIMDYEGGDPTVEDVVNLFSYLVETGQAWTLQGMYGRQAQRLIQAGILDKKGKIDWKKVDKPEEEYYGLNAKKKKISLYATYDLATQYDSRASFYGKARVDVDDTNPRIKTLYSYNTKVAEVRFGKPKVFGLYSQTTTRHIKEFLKQEGFKVESSDQIIEDYGA